MSKLPVLTATLFLSLYGAIANSTPFTLEDVNKLKRVTAVRMNPSGDRIAYLLEVPRDIYVDDDGPPYHELHVTDIEGKSVPFVAGDVDIKDVAWAADGESIFFVAQRDEKVEFDSLYRIALAGGEAELIFTHVNSIQKIYPSPVGGELAFIATDAPPEKSEELKKKGFKAIVYEESVLPAKVWLLDLDSVEAIAHELPGSASDLAWAPAGSFYGVALAPTPLVDDSFVSRDVFVIEADSARVISKLGSVGKLGRFAFSPDGEQLAYVGSVDINDPREGRLYVVPATGGERKELVPDYPGHVSHVIWRSNSRVGWLGSRGLYSEWAIASLNKPEPAGAAPSAGPIVRSVSGNPDQSTLAAVADAPGHPPEVYLLKDGQTPIRVTDSNPWLEARDFARQETISYAARDGLEIEAILIRPKELEPRGNPLIVVAHGGPESNFSNGWMTFYSQPGQVLAANGYAVVFPNYRGSTGRGVAFSKMGQNDLAEEEFNDLVDAKRYLVEQSLVDADRVGITGASYGGYASMWGASALTEEYAAAVAFVGIADQVSMFGTSDIPYELYNVHTLAWPWDDFLGFLKRSPVYHADKTKTPLLIMVGDSDPRVHPSQSLQMYRFTKLRTDTPVRLVVYPGEKHGNRNTAAQYDYSLRFMRWMNHYLKGNGGEPPPYEVDHAARLVDRAEH